MIITALALASIRPMNRSDVNRVLYAHREFQRTTSNPPIWTMTPTAAPPPSAAADQWAEPAVRTSAERGIEPPAPTYAAPEPPMAP